MGKEKEKEGAHLKVRVVRLCDMGMMIKTTSVIERVFYLGRCNGEMLYGPLVHRFLEMCATKVSGGIWLSR